jgi:hypothetical protein
MWKWWMDFPSCPHVVPTPLFALIFLWLALSVEQYPLGDARCDTSAYHDRSMA